MDWCNFIHFFKSCFQLFFILSAMLSPFSQIRLLDSYQVSFPQQIFITSSECPDFFNDHLLDPNRVVKIIKDDPNGLERIFYYQYLKLCEPCEEGFPEARLKNLKMILQNPQFYFTFPGNPQRINHNDQQFKKIGLQFLEIISSGQLSFDSALKKFPIVDKVFTYMMRSLLIINGQAEQIQQFIDKIAVVETLGKILDITYEIFGSYVFVYQQSCFEIYMAYIDDPQENKLRQHIYKMKAAKQQTNRKNQLFKSSGSNGENYQFVDFTNQVNFEEKQKYLHSSLQARKLDNLISQEKFNSQFSFRKEQNKLQTNKQQNQPNKQSNQAAEQDNQTSLSGFQSDEDEPKFKVGFLSSTTFANTDTSKKSVQNPVDIKGVQKIEEIDKQSNNFQTKDFQLPYFAETYKPASIQNLYTQDYNSNKETKQKCQDSFKNIKKQQLINESKYNTPSQQKLPVLTSIFQIRSRYEMNAHPRLNLNVTKQFTNSFILKQMPQINQEKIRMIRERARAYRRAIYTNILMG